MATIKDIANRLGVSVSTVSRFERSKSDISDELDQMVFKIPQWKWDMRPNDQKSRKPQAIFIENMDYEALYHTVLIYMKVSPRIQTEMRSATTGM